MDQCTELKETVVDQKKKKKKEDLSCCKQEGGATVWGPVSDKTKIKGVVTDFTQYMTKAISEVF